MSATLFFACLTIVKNRYICPRILVDKHSPKLNCNKSNDD